MIAITGIAGTPEVQPGRRRAQPPPAANRCPVCGRPLRFDREVPVAGAVRRYYRCTAPECAFECVSE